MAAVLGHVFSPWLNFKGGKGVATSAGVLLGLAPAVLVWTAGLWGLTFAAKRTVSVASLLAATTFPFFVMWLEPGRPALLWVAWALAALVWYRHRDNLQRLRQGVENSFDLEKQGKKKKEKEEMKIVVLGKGAWGGAVGELIRARGHDVAWVEQDDVRMPGPAEMIFLAVPTQAVRACLQTLGPQTVPVVSLSKGVEIETGKRISEIIKELWPKASVAAVSGPSLAGELTQKVPTALVAAAEKESLAEAVQKILHGPYCRVYRTTDLAGVEWGGALKNVYA
jgi:hypothetical protein